MTRADIVAAAMRVLEHDGYDALTIRNVAAELRVKSASLYWHFQTKEELEDSLADSLLANLRFDDIGPGPWKEELRKAAIRAYRHLTSKRDVNRLLTGRFVIGPNALRWMEWSLRIFRSAGFTDRQAAFGSHALRVYVQGFVNFEAAPLSAMHAKGVSKAKILEAMKNTLAELPTETFPNIVALAGVLTERDDGERFLFGLDCLIDGFARLLEHDKS